MLDRDLCKNFWISDVKPKNSGVYIVFVEQCAEEIGMEADRKLVDKKLTGSGPEVDRKWAKSGPEVDLK